MCRFSTSLLIGNIKVIVLVHPWLAAAASSSLLKPYPIFWSLSIYHAILWSLTKQENHLGRWKKTVQPSNGGVCDAAKKLKFGPNFHWREIWLGFLQDEEIYLFLV